MNAKVQKHFDEVLSHLYINPLERCNLKCKICYTRKTDPILSELQILEFINRYEKVKKIQTITFCGGEVFTLKYFPEMVNKLTKGVHFSDSATRARLTPDHQSIQNKTLALKMQRSSKRTPSFEKNKGIFVQIITNGTIDKLEEFSNPNFVNLIVSIDGLPNYHDANRGKGNFQMSTNFLKKAKKLGFHTEIFSIATRQNINQIGEFEQYLCSILNSSIQVTYHPRKPPTYLLHHPESNVFGETDGFDFLTDREMIKITQERLTFPPKNLGCFQIALVSDGRIFGCCEGTIPIGKMDDEIVDLFDKLRERIELWEKSNTLKNCLGCSQPDFMCGIKKYLELLN